MRLLDCKGCDWEDGFIQVSDSATGDRNGEVNTVTVEFNSLPDSSSNSKSVRRFTAEEKEAYELVHKVHLLCLIAQGRIVDSACNDPLIQVRFTTCFVLIKGSFLTPFRFSIYICCLMHFIDSYSRLCLNHLNSSHLKYHVLSLSFLDFAHEVMDLI